jgi:hypothetical protein
MYLSDKTFSLYVRGNDDRPQSFEPYYMTQKIVCLCYF